MIKQLKMIKIDFKMQYNAIIIHSSLIKIYYTIKYIDLIIH